MPALPLPQMSSIFNYWVEQFLNAGMPIWVAVIIGCAFAFAAFLGIVLHR